MTCIDADKNPPIQACVDDPDTFDAALTKELPNLRRYALSLVGNAPQADDLVQDCALQAIRKRHQFRTGTHMRRWLFTILRNLHVDWRRRKARRGPHVTFEEWQPEVGCRPPQDDWMALVDITRRLKALRPCDRKILLLAVFSRLSQRTIARRMGVAEGTVRSRLSRTRAALAS